MSAQGLETTLARLYADPNDLTAFLAHPATILDGADLSPSERMALEGVDKAGLVMAARSFRAKREGYAARKPQSRIARIMRWLGKRVP